MQEKPNMQQLENFLIYGKVRNFAAAAHLANITQSAFSFQMKKLESALGVKLINRNNRGSELTPIGEQFLDKLGPLMHDLDELLRNIQASANKAIDFKVGALMSVGDVLLNRHLANYKIDNPQVKVSVYNLEAQSMLDKLDHGFIDIATTFLLPQMEITNYKQCFCYKEELVYYAPKLPIFTDTVRAEDIGNNPLVSYSPDYFMSKMLKQYFQDKLQEPVIEARLSTPYALMHYCQCNPCGALLSEHLLKEMNVFTGYYHIEDPFYINCYMLYKEDNTKIKTIKAFIDYMYKAFNEDNIKQENSVK